MIYSISGKITVVLENSIVIKNGGLEWELSVSKYTQEYCKNTKDEHLRLYTYLSVTEHGASLYGFSSTEERILFLSLIKVGGIGPRGALKILSHSTTQMLGTMIQDRDLLALSKISGVGKKTAQKILLSLEKLPFIVEGSQSTKARLKNELISSLMQMGYTKTMLEEAYVHLLEEEKIILEESKISQTMKSIIQYLRDTEHE